MLAVFGRRSHPPYGRGSILAAGRPDLTWGIVEQDVLPGMGKPMESARRNREYLRSIGL
jgi:hypothetical protein